MNDSKHHTKLIVLVRLGTYPLDSDGLLERTPIMFVLPALCELLISIQSSSPALQPIRFRCGILREVVYSFLFLNRSNFSPSLKIRETIKVFGVNFEA